MVKRQYIIGAGIVAAALLLTKKARAMVFNYDNLPDGMIGKYFSFDEVIDSPTCEAQGIENIPNANALSNAQALVQYVLDPLREYVGRPILVTSFYRSEQCNNEIGGAENSRHKLGKAADIQLFIDGVRRNDLLLDAIDDLNLPFDRLIREYGTYDNPQWLHIEYDNDKPPGQQQQQYLRIT